MSSSKALASLTASYTDSENEDADNKEDLPMDLETDEERSRDPIEETDDDDDDLPPEPTGKCAPELQEKISNLFYKVQHEGLDVNKEIQSKKTFRNPSIYEKLIDYCGLNEFGTNYPPHIYDPLRWGKESFYDELAKVQKIEMDKRDKEKKEKTKVSSHLYFLSRIKSYLYFI